MKVGEIARALTGERRSWTSTAALADILGDRARSLQGPMMVTPARARRHAAVYACRDLLVRQVATMDVGVFRGQGPALVQVQPAPQIVANPSPLPTVDATGWVAQLVDSLVMRGNAYGLVTEVAASGWPQRIEVLNPDLVSYSQLPGGKNPVWRVAGKEVRLWEEGGDLWHLPRFPPAGSPLGLSVLSEAAEAIGLGLHAQQFGGDWFASGAHPSGVLTVDVDELTDAQATEIKRRFVRSVDGREPVVLGKSARYDRIQIAPNESQFLETIKANGADVARFFGVPPEMVGYPSGDSMTYANVESRAVAYLVATMDPLLVLIERAWSALIPRPQRVCFDRSSLLRADTSTRYASYSVATASGVLTVNEARAKEGLGPIKGGDVPPWARPAAKSADGEVGVADLTLAAQRLYLPASNGLMSADEAREILNRAGAGLTGPAPEPPASPSTNPPAQSADGGATDG